jgi:hypothetical protein
MSMVFPYRLLRSPQPVVSLGGRTNRPRALLDVALTGPTGIKPSTALLDTGADDTVFSEAVARAIGLDLSGAPCCSFTGVGSVPYTVRYSQVTLRATDGREFREWPARVGFTSIPMRYALLGFAGFLQFFTATFRGDREEVELEVNALYPGR